MLLAFICFYFAALIINFVLTVRCNLLNFNIYEKSLVTVGAGYKGIILTQKLLGLGHEVTILDNFMYGYEPVLHLATHPNLIIIKADIRNKVSNISEFDIVFHLAGISGFPACAANLHSAQLITKHA